MNTATPATPHPFDDKNFPSALRALMGYVRMVEVDPATPSATVEYDGRAEHAHSNGTIVQGGIITAWIDHAMACAVAVRDPQARLATLEIKTSFLSRTVPGPAFAKARVVKWGRTTVFLEAELKDAAGKLLATASSTGVLG